MSQSFEGAQPQVVRGKNKYREGDSKDEQRVALNIMYDKRVFRGNTHNLQNLKKNLTPAQKEEQYIKEQREKKKIEMIKAQLLKFKKSKNVTSPYDLKLPSEPRIEVDLTLFLTEQNKAKADETDAKMQTDMFLPKPESPRYIPKKTGIDKITQIEDYDLFDFDTEVQPILNVLLTKTIEQATLEVEEEHELEQIRKYKQGYHKRRMADRNEWELEVKKEIQRIKDKNKALDTARMKRKQQMETISKVQCMHVAKAFLANNLMESMKLLASKNHWRDDFKEQLNIEFKEWMFSTVTQNMNNKEESAKFQNNLAQDQIQQIGLEKEPIKKAVRFSIQAKEKVRQIESKDKRVVHFLFNSNITPKISPFSRKYKAFLEGNLAEIEKEEQDKFENYITRLAAEELEEGETNPIVYGDSPFFTFDIVGGVSRLGFSTADDPFRKTTCAKYYPLATVINKQGEIISQVGPANRRDNKLNIGYLDDIRDQVLKINDDRKIQISLNQISEPGAFILLSIQTFEQKENDKPIEGEFDRAWFRLSNEETNQTFDYSLIKNIELPEDYSPEIAPNDEDENSKPKPNSLTYILGVIYQNQQGNNPVWVYESYKNFFQAKDFQNKDIHQTIGDIYKKSIEEFENQEKAIQEASNALKRSIEEKKQKALEEAKKNKAKNVKTAKKGQADEDEEVLPATKGDMLLASQEMFDINTKRGFEQILQKNIIRPFIFGPVEFEGLNLNENDNPFNPDLQRERVVNVLERSVALPANVCVHGFKVTVKRKTLKRRTTILKHARFLQNLEVLPLWPAEQEIKQEEEQANEDEE